MQNTSYDLFPLPYCRVYIYIHIILIPKLSVAEEGFVLLLYSNYLRNHVFQRVGSLAKLVPWQAQ